jgi:hypothetical protein
MIEVRGGKDHAGVADLGGLDEVGPTPRSTAAVAPSTTRGIEPASIGQTADLLPVWPAAALANAAGAVKPYPAADLWPILRIEPPHLRLDRHPHSVS